MKEITIYVDCAFASSFAMAAPLSRRDDRVGKVETTSWRKIPALTPEGGDPGIQDRFYLGNWRGSMI